MNTSNSAYENVLIAVDLSEGTGQIIERAKAIAPNADCRLVYVLDPVHYANANIAMSPVDIMEQVRERVRSELLELGHKHALSEHPHMVAEGHPASTIHSLAETLQADLIVVGSHGRHGVQLLLGSTANAILHGAKCDVLAVRIGK